MATSTNVGGKDLTKEAPRSPRVRLGGYALMARMIDKGRATVRGTAGEYHFDCPVDNLLFGFKQVHGEDVRRLLESGAGDTQVLSWFNAHGAPKSAEEVRRWSDEVEAKRPYDSPESRRWFEGECKRLGVDPQKTTLFDYLEEDDRQTFATPGKNVA